MEVVLGRLSIWRGNYVDMLHHHGEIVSTAVDNPTKWKIALGSRQYRNGQLYFNNLESLILLHISFFYKEPRRFKVFSQILTCKTARKERKLLHIKVKHWKLTAIVRFEGVYCLSWFACFLKILYWTVIAFQKQIAAHLFKKQIHPRISEGFHWSVLENNTGK